MDEPKPGLEMRAILQDYCEGALPPGVALLRLAGAAENAASLASAVRWAAGRLGGEETARRRRLTQLRRLEQRAPDLWRLVRSVTSSVAHVVRDPADLDANLSQWARAFDRAAALSPEASVALYALGRADLLAVATDEVVAYLDGRGLLGGGRALLDIGCGVGRFELALADRVGRIKGLDISPRMVEIAQHRCAGRAGVEIELYSGRDLVDVTAASFDSVLAIDSFPYIVAASPLLPERFFREVARVLKPAGDFLIVNYSYRDGEAADAADVDRLAREIGFVVLRSGERPFRHWDGRVFHLVKKT